jgi:NTP pyrophosphatase (non-canonical NTP hydrolase)
MISVSLSMNTGTTEHAENPEAKPICPGISVCSVHSVVIPRRMTPIEELRRTMARLRAPDGCPWDREQTHQTLTRCLIDECSELLDTIDRNDIQHMREELGDVLIQVVFHAQLAAERGDFNFDDVAREINEKLVRRHPHVFGTGKAANSAEVIEVWEKVKAGEKAAAGKTESTLFKKLPPRLPALMFAEEVAKRIEKQKLPADGRLGRIPRDPARRRPDRRARSAGNSTNWSPPAGRAASILSPRCARNATG